MAFQFTFAVAVVVAITATLSTFVAGTASVETAVSYGRHVGETEAVTNKAMRNVKRWEDDFAINKHLSDSVCRSVVKFYVPAGFY